MLLCCTESMMLILVGSASVQLTRASTGKGEKGAAGARVHEGTLEEGPVAAEADDRPPSQKWLMP